MNAQELDELLDAHFVGDATEAEQSRLADSLRADAAARRRFVQFAFLEARLHAARTSPLREDPALVAPAEARSRASRPPGIARRLPIRLRQLDLAAIAVVVAIAIAGYYVLRPGVVPKDDIAVEDVPNEQRPDEQAPKVLGTGELRKPDGEAAEDGSVLEPDGKTRRLVGVIESVDGVGSSFVLAGPGESRTSFRVDVVAIRDREPTHVSLDGAPSTFDEAVQARRRAAVVFVPAAAGNAWVWKVEVSSQSR